MIGAMARRLVLAALLAAASPAFGHEGPHTEVAVLDAALAARPGDVELLLQRAALLRREGHLAAALADLAVVAHLAPANREMLLERGLTRAASGDAAGAEADLTRVIEGGASAAALVTRARLREASGRAEEAWADHDAAMRLRPDPESALARGRLDEARGRLDRAAAGYEEALRNLGGAVAIRVALIRVETARGRPDRVVALADEALAQAPLKADWLLIRGDAHAAAGRAVAALRDRTAALREVDETLKRRGGDPTRLTRARALLALGRAAEAARELEGVIARSPGLGEAQTLLAAARRRGRRSP
jgi:tetratricopeptide (TPR) repeat protein